MRVLLLTHLYLPTVGGVQRSVANLATHLARRGHEVSIATHRPGRFGGPSFAREQPAPVLGLDVPDPFSPHPLRLARRLVLDVANAAALAGWCARRRTQVVHCHLVNVDTRYAAVAARASGAKIVVTLRGGETEHWLVAGPHRTRYVRRVLERADYVTAVSEGLLEQARALVPGVAEKSCVIPNPIDAAALRAAAYGGGGSGAPAPAAARARPYVLFVGRLEQMKDVPVLLDAFDLACADPAFTADVVLAGSGSLRPALEARARRSPHRERIVFLGDVEHAAALRWIAGAAMLVLPSKSSEGCPNVALEAMALGVPLVVSDLPSLAELVHPNARDEGPAGAVFPRGDASALAARIVELSRDRALRERYARAAVARLAARHDVERIIASYERVYADVVASGGRAAAEPR